MARPILCVLMIFLLVSFCFASVCVAAEDPELLKARQDFAEHYFSAEAHLRLAWYLAEHEQKLTGFFVSESARRSHFDEATFAKAVRVVYHHDDFQNGPEAEASLLGELKSHPDNAKKHERLA